jgi:hypothetical protein
MSWDRLKWDDEFMCPYVTWMQPKVRKPKLIPFVPGANRHNCWLLDLGDYLVMRKDTDMIYDVNGANWMFPNLQNANNANQALGECIKSVRPGGAAKFKDVAVSCLPENANAGGIRPGAVNMLMSQMPAEIAVHTTGHDMRSVSAVWEYLHADLALCMPGAVVLAGWNAYQWGRVGKPPVPAQIKTLVGMGVGMDQLQSCIDHLYRLDSGAPPMLHRGGSLRAMVECVFATQVWDGLLAAVGFIVVVDCCLGHVLRRAF